MTHRDATTWIVTVSGVAFICLCFLLLPAWYEHRKWERRQRRRRG